MAVCPHRRGTDSAQNGPCKAVQLSHGLIGDVTRPRFGWQPRCAGVWGGTDGPKGTGQARWTTRWKPALNAFAVTFADRMPATANL